MNASPEQTPHEPARDADGEEAPSPGVRAARINWSTILWGAALVAMVVVTYLPVRNAGFIMDDDINIAGNNTLYSPAGLVQMWLVPSSVDQYYPLTHTSFWIEYRLWGFDPLGYHIVNVLLHATNVLLVWRLLSRLCVPGAWLAAAIFAVHPVEVETVAWAVERKNLLSLALALGSILCYLRFSPPERDAARSSVTAERWYTASLVLFAAAMFSKTAVVTLPAVLLVIDWWKRGRLTRREIETVMPFFVIAILLSAVTLYQEVNHVGARGSEFSYTIVERTLMAGRALWFYAGKLLWPYPVMFFYPRFVIDSHAWWQYLFPLAAVALPVGLWLLRNRMGRGPLAGVLIFAGVLMPALGFFDVYFFMFASVADHFQYHASVAFIALFAALAVTAVTRLGGSPAAAQSGNATNAAAISGPWRIVGGALAAGMLAALAVMSYRAAEVYETEEAVCRDVIAKNPDSWIAYSSLGVQLAVQRRYDEALSSLREALRIDPQKARNHHNYASILVDRGEHVGFQPGNVDDAIAHYEQAIQLNPELAAHYFGLGRALKFAGRLDEATVNLNRALEIEPQNANAHATLGEVEQQQEQWAKSAKSFERALRLQPNRPESHFGLGTALASLGQLRPAAEEFSAAARLRPDYLAAWNSLAQTWSKLGETSRAIDALREVARLDPSPQAQESLSQALQGLPPQPDKSE